MGIKYAIYKYFWLFIVICLTSTNLIAQNTGNQPHELKIGETIPPGILTGLLKTTSGSINITSLYQKGLLIIDFGATWCVPCIRELQELDTLSRKYNGKLSVLSVAYEDKKAIGSFFLKHKEIDISLFTIITSDTLFTRLFPHKSLPHNVWIDKHGIIQAITGSEEINDKNIHAFLGNDKPNLLTKHDNMKFDFYEPYHLADTNFSYRAIFARYNPEINSGSLNDRNVNPNFLMKRAFAWNLGIVDLFWLAAFPQLNYVSQFPNYSRIEFHTRDSVRFIPEKYETIKKANVNLWSLKNLFCYELILPKPIPDTLFSKFMVADLERNFNVVAKIEKRDQPCLVMTRKKGLGEFPISKKKTKSFDIELHDIAVHKMTVDEFLNEVFVKWDTMPILNETRISYPLDFLIPFDKGVKLTDIIAYLEKNGFDLKEEIRPLNKLVLYDMTN
ncbi:TlpA family protein disulfide reductase [Mucilaginibacter sp. UYCu711]|uniref:TlpA family protein disulfide reductase n=1 Tax=Mucilaginibacter sp. UYCu711 TaxID=3156339 RepID=UPI003D19AD77